MMCRNDKSGVCPTWKYNRQLVNLPEKYNAGLRSSSIYLVIWTFTELLIRRIMQPLFGPPHLKETKPERYQDVTDNRQARPQSRPVDTTETYLFCEEAPPPTLVGGRKGGTPALRLAWHCPRHRAGPVWVP